MADAVSGWLARAARRAAGSLPGPTKGSPKSIWHNGRLRDPVANPEERPTQQSLQRWQGRSLAVDSGRAPWMTPRREATRDALPIRCRPGGPRRIDQGYKVTNGPAFSPSGELMYHNDSARQVTYAFDLDDQRQRGRPPHFPASFGEGDGYPDGMTVDSEGCLWIAFWDGGCVRRFSPAGECLRNDRNAGIQADQLRLRRARSRPTLRHARRAIGLDETALAMQPNAGGLFMVSAGGARAFAEFPFAG